jgi:hypothetical protein
MILYAMDRRSYLTMMVMKKEKLNISITMIPPLIGKAEFIHWYIFSICYLHMTPFNLWWYHTLPDCWIVIK